MEIAVNYPPLKKSLQFPKNTRFGDLKILIYNILTVYKFCGVFFKHFANCRHLSTIVGLSRTSIYNIFTVYNILC